MPINRELLRDALRELVQMKSGTEHPTRLLFQLYASALEEWAWKLGIEPQKLNKLVMVRQAVSGSWLH